MICLHHADSLGLARVDALATMDDFRATGAWIVAHYMLIPVLAMGVVVLVGLVALAIALTRIAKRKASLALESRRFHIERFRPDGAPYPPFSRGMCDRCERPFDKVYFMPEGNRLCPKCYEIVEIPAATGDAPPSQEEMP